MSPTVYAALVAQLFRVSWSLRYGEALLAGSMGAIAAVRAQDPLLGMLTAATTLGVVALGPCCRRYDNMRVENWPARKVRRVEHQFELHSYAVSLGAGLMVARGLLATDDMLVHMMLLLLAMGAAMVGVRHHYRPHITAGKTLAVVLPAATALALVGDLYYLGIAVVALVASRIFIQLTIQLFDNAEAQLKTLQEKELLAKALNQRNREFRQREQHQREVERALQRVQADLIHVSRINAMGTMASTLAHEINQPLAAVSNYVRGSRRLIEKGGENNVEAARDALSAAEETIERTAEIVRRIRSLVFRGEVETKPQQLASLVEAARQHALAEVELLGVQFHTEIEPRAQWVNVDGVQIQQVLINLIRNALEAMRDSELRRIRINARAISSAQVELVVADTGPGISDEMKESLFSSFQTDKPEGMGMGLSISRTIIEAHGGQIVAEDAPGGGAQFRMTLPRWKMPAAAAAN